MQIKIGNSVQTFGQDLVSKFEMLSRTSRFFTSTSLFSKLELLLTAPAILHYYNSSFMSSSSHMGNGYSDYDVVCIAHGPAPSYAVAEEQISSTNENALFKNSKSSHTC